ncbi:MAG: MarR family transcriptional regulator [Candidatus Lokiarchaeia archaeon]
MNELEEIFDGKAQTRVLQFLLENKGKAFNLSEIAEQVEVAHSTVGRVIKQLLDQELVEEITRWKQMRIVRLNEENEKAKILLKFLEDIKNLKEVQ